MGFAWLRCFGVVVLCDRPGWLVAFWFWLLACIAVL